MLRIVICDDDNMICSQIDEIIVKYQEITGIKCDISVFYSGDRFINYLKEGNKCDLVFLDIELGDITGIDVGNVLRYELDNYACKIVFITSKNGYEQKLFDLQPLNFLKKPIETEKVKKCLNLAVKLLKLDNQTFEYKKGSDVFKVDLKDILYFESIKRQVKIVTFSGEDQFYSTLESIKSKLPKTFIESHGSFVANFENVSKITGNSLVMKNNVEIPISQRNMKNVRTLLIDFEKERNRWHILKSYIF